MTTADQSARNFLLDQDGRTGSLPDPSGPDRRHAQLAVLAAQIAGLERRDQFRSPRSGDEAAAGARTELAARGKSGAGGESGAPTKSGGHPDDAAGNPETMAKAICLRLLTIAPRPRAGLRQALRRQKVPDEVAERVLDRLTEVGLVDDAAYAASFVRTKQRDRGLGRSALHAELRRIGVDDQLASDAVSQVDADDERIRAIVLINKRIEVAMASGPVAAKRRLLAMLARRGYPADLSVRVVDEAMAGYRAGREGWSSR